MRRLESRRECRALCDALLFLHPTLIGVGANARSLLASVGQARPVHPLPLRLISTLFG